MSWTFIKNQKSYRFIDAIQKRLEYNLTDGSCVFVYGNYEYNLIEMRMSRLNDRRYSMAIHREGPDVTWKCGSEIATFSYSTLRSLSTDEVLVYDENKDRLYKSTIDNIAKQFPLSADWLISAKFPLRPTNTAVMIMNLKNPEYTLSLNPDEYVREGETLYKPQVVVFNKNNPHWWEFIPYKGGSSKTPADSINPLRVSIRNIIKDCYLNRKGQCVDIGDGGNGGDGGDGGDGDDYKWVIDSDMKGIFMWDTVTFNNLWNNDTEYKFNEWRKRLEEVNKKLEDE